MKTLFLDSGQGLLPFIFETLKKDIKGDFIFFFDEKNFPYGNKDKDDVKKILDKHLENFEKIEDLKTIVIACNTLSTLIDKTKKYPFEIITILDYNLSLMNKNITYLCTKITGEYLNTLGIKALIAKDLAFDIEHQNIEKIITFIKSIKEDLFLGCTHYPLIKPLLNKYSKYKFYSYEEEFIKKFNNGEKCNITLVTTKEKEYKKIFSSSCIKIISPTYFLTRGDIR